MSRISFRAVAGGNFKQWTKVEKDRLREMKYSYDDLCKEYAAGKVTKAELDKAFDELANFMRETDKKYT